MHSLRWVAFMVLLVGCQVTAERVSVMPLPDDGRPLPYPDAVQRIRFQAAAANEAFYVDKWTDLHEAATAIEKTAGYFLKAEDVPDGQKAKLPARIAEVTKLCGQLREAAKAQDVKKANDALQQINLKVRELRP